MIEDSPEARTGGGRRRSGWLGALIGAAAITLGARLAIALPATPVPQSAQTLAVLLVGGVLGGVWGPVSVVLYVVAGALGLPVFADGASGVEVLWGPTAGYLLGFVVAAWWMGQSRAWVRRYSHWVLAGLTAHLVVLTLGWVWLARSLGPASALEVGVAPFLVGGLWKSLAAAMVLAAHERVGKRRVGSDRGGG